MIGTRLDWAFVLLVSALVAAVFWLAGLAGTATGFTLALFGLALILAAILFAMHLLGGHRTL